MMIELLHDGIYVVKIILKQQKSRMLLSWDMQACQDKYIIYLSYTSWLFDACFCLHNICQHFIQHKAIKLWQGTSALSFTFYLLFYIHNYIIYSYVDDLS